MPDEAGTQMEVILPPPETAPKKSLIPESKTPQPQDSTNESKPEENVAKKSLLPESKTNESNPDEDVAEVKPEENTEANPDENTEANPEENVEVIPEVEVKPEVVEAKLEETAGKIKPKSKKELKALRKERAMKPLTQKCVPDKSRPPKNPAIPVNKSNFKKKSALHNVHRKNSDLVFIMPKVQDPSEIQKRKTVKMVHKLIKYMKKSWKVKVDPRQAERELLYRTINTVTTTKPENWRDLIEEREQTAVETGFFCGFDDGPYQSLINLELDTPMLVFNNLPPDLKITATRWLRDKALKEELKKKRDAFLPRLPRNKIKRPSFVRGRLFKDPGGTNAVDKFVQVAEGFQKLTKGSASYAKVLTDYAQKKEDENENSNSGFGAISGGLKYGFKAASTANEESENSKGDREEEEFADERRQADSRRDSIIDGRKYQREMLTMEYMISALYDIIKSILNIRNKQLTSMLPLPKAVVLQLRDKSPENKVGKKAPPMSLLKRVKRHPGIYTNVGTFALNTPVPSPRRSHVNNFDSSEEEDEEEEEDDEEMTEELCIPPDEWVRNSVDDVAAALSEQDLMARSSTRLFEDIRRVHSKNDKLKHHKNKKNNAEKKIKRLIEPPEHAAMRLARNAATYTKLFERHQKIKPPIWHSNYADNFTSTQTGSGMNQPKDATHLTDADADEMVEQAMRKRQTMQSDRRWPNESQILTPTFPFGGSAIRIPSDEQSRRDLLAKTGNIHEIPSTPVRRLYKLAGVRTTDKQVFNTLLDMKRSFRATEKKVRTYYENEIGKIEWDTVKRFRSKLNAITPDPVYQWTIAIMRQATQYSIDEDEEDGRVRLADEGGIKRQALWYRRLLEECSSIGAVRHNGCQVALSRLIKYCDVDLKSKPQMLSRLALLVCSLPTTELGSRHWQQAILFLLEHLYGAPHDILFQWLNYRGLPFLG